MTAVVRTLHHLRRLRARRGLTLLVLVAFCATLMPLPMISSVPLKHGDEAFPCQDSLCGCRTAHQCWTSCCCTTPAQRLAWAHSRGIVLPAYAQHALQTLVAAAAKPAASAKSSHACCVKKVTASCCKSKPLREPAAEAKRPVRRYLIGALVLGCHGKDSAMSSLPWAIMPTPAPQVGFLPTESRWQREDLSPIAVTHIPPLPPPRHS